MDWITHHLAVLHTHPLWLLAILFCIALSKSTIILSSVLPPASVMLMTVVTLAFPVVPIVIIWLVITLGAACGSMISYYLGRLIITRNYFPGLMAKYKTALGKAQARLQTSGLLILFTSRFIAVLRYLIPMAAGLLRFTQTRVLVTCLLSAGVWTALYMLIAKGIEFTFF
ncbi:DedA family protein [Morganella morganii]|uniref:DedA family protein n=1 Tax=Morganella morganii TaxID=582 RepID=UPI001BDAA78D|nr:VTT domain-containing protein [Morganella morganii]MBT0396505.1 VTT domain-containing protein [Morganella morganii subsp. morganii]MBT0462377.1 VTT domain-containing protein [Morganella morganii subsp. morganii]